MILGKMNEVEVKDTLTYKIKTTLNMVLLWDINILSFYMWVSRFS